MNKFVISPNLPENTKHVLLGKRYAPLLDNALTDLGIMPIYLGDNPDMDKRLAAHADLSAMYSGKGKLFLAPFFRDSMAAGELSMLGLELIFPEISLSAKYPHDAQMNICLFGDKAIYNPAVSFPNIISENVKKITVNQGYCRCSVCVVNENAIITSDRGIYSKALFAGIDTLLISPGGIMLEGYDYGFIGGSSFKIARDIIAFTGILDAHPGRKMILDFLKKHKIEPVFLTEKSVFDIGTAIPLTEK